MTQKTDNELSGIPEQLIRDSKALTQRDDAFRSAHAALARVEVANARADAAERNVIFWNQAAKNLGEERIAAESETAALREDLELVTQQRDGARRALVSEVAARKTANARIAELEVQWKRAQRDQTGPYITKAAWQDLLDTANARADAAEHFGSVQDGKLHDALEESAYLRAQVERLRGTKTRVREAQLMHSLAGACVLLEELDLLLEQTMNNTPHPPSFSNWKEGSANIRTWLKANPEVKP